ncbi:MAG: phage integrase N-terminal SAM-like domain-containing protein [Candidatus Thiodiazotropha sp. (ex Dulcina madagascariensis)]|nr:phage integrase N-terminal SAM-like domain-containing protein [Candidatus Thiodiazotropha sp. (ex Dulcina madagascariensis)]
MPDKAVPWYRRHVQGFIDDHPSIRLQAHNPESLQHWLQQTGHNNLIDDWQFRQLAKQFPDIYRKFLVAIRIPDYSINTEKRYLGWINRFLRFHRHRLPSDCSEPDVASFLEHLAIQRKVAVATQSQALNARVFFFRVLERPLGEIGPKKGLSQDYPSLFLRLRAATLF